MANVGHLQQESASEMLKRMWDPVVKLKLL